MQAGPEVKTRRAQINPELLHVLPDEDTQLSWALLDSMPQSSIPTWAVDASMRSLKASKERQLSRVLDESESSLKESQSMDKDQKQHQDKGKQEDKDKDKHSSIEVPSYVLRSLKASQSKERVQPRPKPGPKPNQL